MNFKFSNLTKTGLLGLSALALTACSPATGKSQKENLYEFYIIPQDQLIVDFSELTNGASDNASEMWLMQTNLGLESCETAGVKFYYPKDSSRAVLNNHSKSKVEDMDLEGFLEHGFSEITVPSYVQDGYELFQKVKLEPSHSGFSARAADSSSGADEAKNYNIGDKRRFFVQSNLNEANLSSVPEVEAEMSVSGKYCNIWLADYGKDNEYYTQLNSSFMPDRQQLEKLAGLFDTIYEPETNLLGSIEIRPYVNVIDTPSKIDILLFDIENDAKIDESGYFTGYFYPIDLIKNGTNIGSSLLMHSNETAMFYLDTKFFMENPDEIYITLSHEFAHMLFHINKSMKNSKNYSTYFTELIAAMTQDIMYDGYLDRFCEKDVYRDGRALRFLVSYTNGFIPWENTINDYACGYMFGAFIARNYGGAKILHEIATNDGEDIEAFIMALQKLGYCNSEDWGYEALKFPLILVNNSSDGITVNRTVKTRLGNYIYTNKAIDLYSYCYKTNDGQEKYGPYILDLQKVGYKIGAMGTMPQKIPNDAIAIEFNDDIFTEDRLYLNKYICIKKK